MESPPPPLFRESQLMAPWLMLPILVALPAFFWYLGATLPRPFDLVIRVVASFATLRSLFAPARPSGAADHRLIRPAPGGTNRDFWV
jgi:hypothetical protein